MEFCSIKGIIASEVIKPFIPFPNISLFFIFNGLNQLFSKLKLYYFNISISLVIISPKKAIENAPPPKVNVKIILQVAILSVL